MPDKATTRTELKELFERRADWRADAGQQYPEDRRHQNAVDIFLHLAKTVDDVPQSTLDAYNAAFYRWGVEDYGLEIALVRDVALREVGFRTAPENAETWIRDFLARIDWDQRRNVYRARIRAVD